MRRLGIITLIRVDLRWTKYGQFKRDINSGFVSPPIESKKMDSRQNPIQNEGQRKLEFKAKKMAFLTHYLDNWAGPIRIRSHQIVCKQSNRHASAL